MIWIQNTYIYIYFNIIIIYIIILYIFNIIYYNVIFYNMIYTYITQHHMLLDFFGKPYVFGFRDICWATGHDWASPQGDHQGLQGHVELGDLLCCWA